MQPVNFGIDLGTTNSLIAKFEHGRVVVFRNPVGHKEALASVVGFRKDRTLIGDKAKEFLFKDPVNVFGSFKRKMGTDEKYYVVNLDENVTPIELSSYILQELKSFVPREEQPEVAVITIPASFDTMQSNATLEAGKRAGFLTVFLLQEPIAASLAYFNQPNNVSVSDGYWLVYDLGGGTFDVALVRIQGGDMHIVDHAGNNFLGGVDFDTVIVDEIVVPYVIEKTGIEDFQDRLILERGEYEKLYNELILKAENAKIELSNYDVSEIEFSMEINGHTEDFLVEVSRDQYHQLIHHNVQDTIKMINDVIRRNELTPADIHQIVLVGGSTYSPYIKGQLEQQTGIRINDSIDPTTAIAVGAAYYAANKYYEPAQSPVSIEVSDLAVEDVLSEDGKAFYEAVREEKLPFTYHLSYSKTSKEEDELLLVKFEGGYTGYSCRIYRVDGGFDTGVIPIRPKLNEFLTLMPNVLNHFVFKIYDAQNGEVLGAMEDVKISHGQFNIDGQPLPKDICIEVDDLENNETKLEVIFEKNSLLPQKKILYREISKTIKKGSSDSLVINILEGDRFARPISNLIIGCIEIHGKDLVVDLVKGSDIEIQVVMSESRTLSTEIYLVMSGQTYKNVFSISEKHIHIDRLKEQFLLLENDIRASLKQFSYNHDEVWAIQTKALLDELMAYKDSVQKLKDRQKDDKRYIIAEVLTRISQEFDKVGGNNRIGMLRKRYLDEKERLYGAVQSADFEKDTLLSDYGLLLRDEEQVLRTKNGSVIERMIKRVEDLQFKAKTLMISHLILQFQQLKGCEPRVFTDYKAVENMFKIGDGYIQENKFMDLRSIVFSIYGYLRREYLSFSEDSTPVAFKGTGIR